MLGTWIVLVSASLLANQKLAAVTTLPPQSSPGTNAVVMQPSVTGAMARTSHVFAGTLTLPTDLPTSQRPPETAKTDTSMEIQWIRELQLLFTTHERRLNTMGINLNTNLLAVTTTQHVIQNTLESAELSFADLTERNCITEMRQWQLEQNGHLNNERLCRLERTLWIAIGIIGLTVVWGFWHTESRLRHAERLFVQERRVDANTSEETPGTSCTTLAEPQGSHTTQSPSCPIGSQHSAIHDEVSSPQELLRRLTAAARRTVGAQHIPATPVAVSWGIGLTSSKGPVRDRNEDYALTFEINKHQVILIADGVGGMPHGQQAAYYAVRAAAWRIVQSLGRQQTASSAITSDTLARDAVQHAARSLGNIVRCHLGTLTTGFRTTLIVIVATRTHYHFCYLGDGGGCVRRADGTCVRFLVPQKADPDTPNILAGSLGPITQGEPVCGTLPRLPGDLLVCGTDGVMDRLGTDSADRIWEAAMKMEGKLQCIADRLVEQMSSAHDEHGYICDDNLTIALLGTGILDGKATVRNAKVLVSSRHLSSAHIREGLVTACSVLLRLAVRLRDRVAANIRWPTLMPRGD